MVAISKLEQGRKFVAEVEADMGHSLENHIIDLFMDNADKLGFTDNECLEVGNAVRADKGLPPVAKWWTDKPVTPQAFADRLTPAQAIALYQIADPLTDADRAEFDAMSDDDLLRELTAPAA